MKDVAGDKGLIADLRCGRKSPQSSFIEGMGKTVIATRQAVLGLLTKQQSKAGSCTFRCLDPMRISGIRPFSKMAQTQVVELSKTVFRALYESSDRVQTVLDFLIQQFLHSVHRGQSVIAVIIPISHTKTAQWMRCHPVCS